MNLIGEHTDYNQGFVLPMAIERETKVAVSRNNLNSHRIYSANTDELVELSVTADSDGTNWVRYPLGVIKLLADTDQGFDIAITSDVPIGAGLSSSAALECSIASALNELMNLQMNKLELAKVCQRAENEVVGAPTGNMDQIASLFGQEDKAVFIDCQTEEIQPTELGLNQAELDLMVIDTKTSHDLSDGDYGNRRNECFAACRALGLSSLRDLAVDDLSGALEMLSEIEQKRVRHVVDENARVLATVQALEDRDFDAVGKLMLDSHRSMRDDFEISTAELDAAVETAAKSGALGARMTGGGFGGSAVALVKVNKFTQIENQIKSVFESLNFPSPDIFKVSPSVGAAKIAVGK